MQETISLAFFFILYEISCCSACFLKEYFKQYFNTPMGRASRLVTAYKQSDRKYNRGECTLTAKWIVNNIFTKPCAHCRKSGWQVIGCNRLDNSRPHTEYNVEPCCKDCNDELAADEKKQILGKQVYQYTKDGELVAVFGSTIKAERQGYNHSCISNCVNGRMKTYKGYVWTYEPKKENLESIATF